MHPAPPQQGAVCAEIRRCFPGSNDLVSALARQGVGGRMGRWTPGRREDCWRGCWRGRSSRRWARWWCSVSSRTSWRGARSRRSCRGGWRRRRRARRRRSSPSSSARSVRATRGRSPTRTCAGDSTPRAARLGVRRVLAVTPRARRARRQRGRAAARRAGLRSRGRSRRDRARRWPGRRPPRRCSSVTTACPTSAPTRVVGEPGEVAGLVAVEGNADYPAMLAAFRRSMIAGRDRRRDRRAGADRLDRAADLGADHAPGAGGGAARARRSRRAGADRNARRDRSSRADVRRDARGAARRATKGCR